MNIRQFFTEFPWIRSFIVAMLASGVFFVASNPDILNSFVLPTLSYIVNRESVLYGSFVISLLGFTVSAVSFYYQRKQNKLQSNMRDELVRRDIERENDSVMTENSSDLDDLTKTPEELLTQQINRIEDYLWISEEGEVQLSSNDLGEVERLLVYLIGIRYACELDLIDTPQVNAIEIGQATNIPFGSVTSWAYALDEIIEREHYDLFRFNEYSINISNIPIALDYVEGDRRLPEKGGIPHDLDPDPWNAREKEPDN